MLTSRVVRRLARRRPRRRAGSGPRRGARSRRSAAASSSCPSPTGPSIVKNSPARDLEVDAVDGDDVAVTPCGADQPDVGRCDGSDVSWRSALASTSASSSSVEPAVEILVGRDERDEDADDVAVQAAREKDQAALARGRRRRASRASAPAPSSRGRDELEREHRAEPAHLADRRPRARRSPRAAPQPRAELRPRAPEVRGRDLVEHGEPLPRTRAGCRRTCRRDRRGAAASITSARPVTAASGRPPPSDFPETSRSGSTP